jgi:beta-glucosidase
MNDRRALRLFLMTTLIVVLHSAWAPAPGQKRSQPVLGTRSAMIITRSGLQFKDLNRNLELDPYEDWRLSDEQRAAYLVSKMSLEEKAGFMIISTTRMQNDNAFQRSQNNATVGSGFNEDDNISEVNMFTRKPLPVPNMSAAGTTKAVTKFHERHFILRANAPVRVLAEWSNNLQALCESDGHGIPALVASNPRNHITMDAALGLSVGATAFSVWPGELGLAAMRDFKLTREFADIARQEWSAVGIRKGYMYMADLATDPRWQRIEGTFGENADLSAKMISEIVLGFQGEKLNNTSVAMTTKHFPGGGATENGQDPHFDWGKREVFEGGMFEYNLIPFKAAIDAGTSAIMPYYSIPIGTTYPEVAYAYNKEVLRGLLREKMGFKGIINSDTGPIDMMPWGVENLAVVDRYKMALEAGVNIFSGSADPSQLIEALKKYPDLMRYVDESVQLLLVEKFRMGLFENPYVDVDHAEKKVNKPEFKAKADVAMRKSIVLLRNEAMTGKNKILPLAKGTRVYFEGHQQRPNAQASQVIIPDNNGDVVFVKTPEEADVIVMWLSPRGKSLFSSDGSPISLSLSKNSIDVEYVNKLASMKPLVLAINFSNPWVISEVYNDQSPNIKGVIATFGTTREAMLDVITGKFRPTGKMPFTTPLSEEAAQNQKSDVPGYLEKGNYGLFRFDEGLSY